MKNKPKYQLGMLIQYKDGSGVIDGIVSRKNEIGYLIEGDNGYIAEHTVIAAFKSVATRKYKKKKSIEAST